MARCRSDLGRCGFADSRFGAAVLVTSHWLTSLGRHIFPDRLREASVQLEIHRAARHRHSIGQTLESLIESGAHVAFGSDWYVAPATPLEGIYAAVTRRTLDNANPDGWVPEQKITVEQALRAYTFEGAFASFDENTKGRIEVGMLADLVLFDRDLTTIEPSTIRETRVLRTIVGGRIVFSR